MLVRGTATASGTVTVQQPWQRDSVRDNPVVTCTGPANRELHDGPTNRNSKWLLCYMLSFS